MPECERVYCNVRGFVVDTSSHGSPGNTDPAASCYTYHITESGKFETGHFSIQMAGLKSQTKYYYRACVHSLAGWGYGEEVTFTTKKKGFWKKITSYLELEYLELGFPSGVKVRFKRKE